MRWQVLLDSTYHRNSYKVKVGDIVFIRRIEDNYYWYRTNFNNQWNCSTADEMRPATWKEIIRSIKEGL